MARKPTKSLWLAVDLLTFRVAQEGFNIRSEGQDTFYAAFGKSAVGSIDDLATSEYAQAVEVNVAARKIRFGRDYLGHYPLLFSATGNKLFISDSIALIRAALIRSNVKLHLSPESVALYFALGYVPQGRTIFEEIIACESASTYEWQNGRVLRHDTFRPIDACPEFDIREVGVRLETEVADWVSKNDRTDVWCSGGIDSSIIALLCSKQSTHTELVTLGYGMDIERALGEGEQPYAREIANACRVPLRQASMTAQRYRSVHRKFSRHHIGPEIDTCVFAKYILAEESCSFVINGEGSDPLFGGPKNNQMIYAQTHHPAVSLGWLYALAHERFFLHLPEVLLGGESLMEFVREYLEKLLTRYPGDLLRKLLYVNTLFKASSSIFNENYYAGQLNGIRIRHPFASMGVYEAAFSLPDHRKFQFPTGKLCLTDLYGKQLPKSIVRRRKSATIVPLPYYLESLPGEYFDFSELLSTGLFTGAGLKDFKNPLAREKSPGMAHAFVTLNQWLKMKGEPDHDECLSVKTGYHDQSLAAAAI